MNKKFLIYGLPIVLGLMLVTAGLIQYYGRVQQNVLVTQGLTIDGHDWNEITTETFEGVTSLEAKTVSSKVYDLKNTANVNANVDLNSVCTSSKNINSCEEIKTETVGTLRLTKKEVNFEDDSPPWEEVTGDSDVIVEYTIVGDEFSAKVVSGEVAGYELIYYKDNSDRFNSPAQAILVESVEGNLPYTNDRNTDEYDYCDLNEYDTCHGAKIWYVPGGVIDWNEAENFYFETELIQFNLDGQITVYPDEVLDFMVVSEFPIGTIPGGYFITTSVNPTA